MISLGALKKIYEGRFSEVCYAPCGGWNRDFEEDAKSLSGDDLVAILEINNKLYHRHYPSCTGI